MFNHKLSYKMRRIFQHFAKVSEPKNYVFTPSKTIKSKIIVLQVHLADAGKARGCSTNTSVIHSFIHKFTDPLVPTDLRRCHAQTVRDRSSS